MTFLKIRRYGRRTKKEFLMIRKDVYERKR